MKIVELSRVLWNLLKVQENEPSYVPLLILSLYINLEVENRNKSSVIPNKNGLAIPIKMLKTEKLIFLIIFLIIDFLKPVEYFLSGRWRCSILKYCRGVHYWILFRFIFLVILNIPLLLLLQSLNSANILDFESVIKGKEIIPGGSVSGQNKLTAPNLSTSSQPVKVKKIDLLITNWSGRRCLSTFLKSTFEKKNSLCYHQGIQGFLKTAHLVQPFGRL